MKKLAIVSTHPIQYYAPFFSLLSKEKVIVKVFYTGGNNAFNKFDKGFGKSIEWDLPLLDGYDHEFMINTAKDPGTHHFRGIVNPDLENKIRQFSPDAVLVYGWAWSSHLQIIRSLSGKIPLWFRGDSTLENKGNKLKRVIKKVVLTWIYRKIDKSFYPGEKSKDYFLAYGLKPAQLVFMPHAVDNDRFGVSRNDESQIIRRSLKVNEDDVLILFAGKLDNNKNCELLIQAFEANDLPNPHLLIVGNGEREDHLKKMTNNKNIHFRDFQNQSDLPVYYQACDIFCLPSKSETWGLAVNEAMACAKAIIVSDKVGAALDLVTDQYNGFTFKSDDLADLEAKLKQIASDRQHCKKLGLNSFERIANFSFQVQVNMVMQEISKL